ncbi:tetratricopeptide repeat protein [Candidatus Hydrogenedentota bacterium]
MVHYTPTLIKILKRGAIAFPMFIIAGCLFRSGATGGNIDSVGLIFIAYGLVSIAAVIIAPSIAEIIGECFGGHLYFHSSAKPRPPQSCSRAEVLRSRGLFEESIKEYERMSELYPEEMWPYTEIVDILTRDLGLYDHAVKVCERGKIVLADTTHKQAISLLHRSVDRSPEIRTLRELEEVLQDGDTEE